MTAPPVCPGCGAQFSHPLHPLATTLLCEHCSTLSVVDGTALRLPDTPEWDRLLRLPHVAVGIQQLRRRREQHRHP